MSSTAIFRIWQAFGLQPYRVDTFKLSNDPLFTEKVRDIVGLYLNSTRPKRPSCCAWTLGGRASRQESPPAQPARKGPGPRGSGDQ